MGEGEKNGRSADGGVLFPMLRMLNVCPFLWPVRAGGAGIYREASGGASRDRGVALSVYFMS